MGSTRLRNFNYSRNTVAKTFKNNLFAEEIRNLLTSTYVNMEWKPLTQKWWLEWYKFEGFHCYHLTFSYNGKSCPCICQPGFSGGHTHYIILHTLCQRAHPSSNQQISRHLFANRLRKNQPPERSTWNLEGKLRQAAVADVWKGIYGLRMSNSTKICW